MNITGRAIEAVESVSQKIRSALRSLNRQRQSRRRRAGLEGEGSYEGTRLYNAGVKKYVAAGGSAKAAEAANAALNGREGASLRDAELAGKAGPRKWRSK